MSDEVPDYVMKACGGGRCIAPLILISAVAGGERSV